MKSTHPFDPYTPDNITKLIIGSIPPARFCKNDPNVNTKLKEKDVNWYYGSQDNSFWDILGNIFDKKFTKNNTKEAIEERKDFLAENHIGILDIVKNCSRQDDSAQDNKLSDMELLPIETIKTLLRKHNIETIFYTSTYIKSLMYKLLGICHKTDKAGVKNDQELCLKNKHWVLEIDGKKYKIRILYSPSPNGLRRVNKEIRQKQYEKFLNNQPSDAKEKYQK